MWAWVRRPCATPKSKLGTRWSQILKAWWAMKPAVSEPKSPKDILAWPVFRNSASWPRYRPIVYDRVTYDEILPGWRLRTTEELDNMTEAAREQAIKEIAGLRRGSVWEADKIGKNLQHIQEALPRPKNGMALPPLTVAGTPISEVNAKMLRVWRRNEATKNISANLEEREVGKYGQVPEKIWQWVHHPSKPTQIQELHYKLIFNALPLAGRTRFFTTTDKCYACPETQNIGHFVSSCWTAQVV
jgi:hypothetical protein